MRSMKLKTFLTGKFCKTNDGFEERTFLCLPADKEPEDVLSKEQQAEFGDFFKPTGGGGQIYDEKSVLTLPNVPAAKLFAQIDQQGFATFVVLWKS